MVEDPPRDRNDVGLSIGPLFQSKDYDPAALFPRLWDAVGNVSVAAAVVDLCNYVTREGLVREHPASTRKSHLIALLGELAQRLSRMEEAPAVTDDVLGQVAKQVEDSVDLAVALCHAFALLGDAAAIGKLRQALPLRHRRLRTEAAAALARLGEEEGRERSCRWRPNRSAGCGSWRTPRSWACSIESSRSTGRWRPKRNPNWRFGWPSPDRWGLLRRGWS